MGAGNHRKGKTMTDLQIIQTLSDYMNIENEIRATKEALRDPETRHELERIARKLNRQ